jgi:hypothetical protein
MDSQWMRSDFSPNRQWIETVLGPEWGDAWDFFGRMVSHFSVEALEMAGPVNAEKAKAAGSPPGGPHMGPEEIESLRRSVRAHIPSTLDEVTPFAVRQIWNQSLAGQARKQFTERLRTVCGLNGATWNVQELEERVDAIMG